MAQFARPDADLSDGGFTPSAGSDLYAVLDDNEDTNYIQSAAAADDACQVGLGNVTDPESSSDHVIRARLRRSKAVASYNATIVLKQGSTTISTLSVSDVSNTTTTYSKTLSGAEADAITDYTDLNLTLTADYVSGSGCYLLCGWLELEVPNAAGTTYDDALSIGRTAGVIDGGLAVMTGAVSIGRVSAVSDGGMVEMSLAINIERTAEIDQSGPVWMYDVLALGKIVGVGKR